MNEIIDINSNKQGDEDNRTNVEWSRRAFLSRGSKLAGAMAVPTAVGIGALGTVMPSYACSRYLPPWACRPPTWGPEKTTEFLHTAEPTYTNAPTGNIFLREYTDLLQAGGVLRGIYWTKVQVKWQDLSNGLSTKGNIFVFDVNGTARSFSFQFNRVSDNAGNKVLDPNSMQLKDTTNNTIISYTGPIDDLRRSLADDTPIMPPAWNTDFNIFSSIYYAGQNVYSKVVDRTGAKWLGMSLVTITIMANYSVPLNGRFGFPRTKYATPEIFRTYYALQGYVGNTWTTYYFDSMVAYNTLYNTFRTALNYRWPLVIAGITNAAAYISAFGAEWVAFEYYKEDKGPKVAYAITGFLLLLFSMGTSTAIWCYKKSGVAMAGDAMVRMQEIATPKGESLSDANRFIPMGGVF